MARSIGKVNVAYRYWFNLRLGTGAPATGVAAVDITVTVRNPGNSATMAAPTITEHGGGLYFFDISATFTNTHGAGQYGVTIDVDSTTPRVRDTGGQSVAFFAQDLDDLAAPGDAMDLVTDAVDADAVATSGAQEIRDEILSDSTPFAGANIDAAISSRSSHTAADAADAVWDEATAAHVGAGSFGAEVQAKAEPGDAMDLVTDAVDAAAVATSGAQEIRDEILSDSTPFAGANIDAAISSRSSHSAADAADAVWDEDIVAAHGTADTAGLLLRALGALISQRTNNANLNALLGVADVAARDLPEQVDIELTATHGAGAWTTGAGGDWTPTEREQIRFRLAMDGTQTDPTTDTGTIEDILASLIANDLAATAGSSSTEVRTGATQADGFYDEMVLIVVNSAGVAARRITGYLNTNGAFTVDPALPFTPAVSDRVIVLSRIASSAVDIAAIADGVWDEATAGHVAAGTFGEEVQAKAEPGDAMDLTPAAEADVVDAVWDEPTAGHTTAGTTGLELQVKAEPGDAMTLAANAVNASAVATSGAQEIRDEILSDSTPFAGANVDAAISTRATQADILSDATPFPGGNIDAAISSRASATALSDLASVTKLIEVTVAAGSSATSIRTSRTEADDFWNDMTILVEAPTGVLVARRIGQYNNTAGEFIPTEPLPFTPGVGDRVIILAQAQSDTGVIR